MDRANQLPGLSAGGTIGEGGNVGIQTSGGLLGFGTKASLQAIEATKDESTDSSPTNTHLEDASAWSDAAKNIIDKAGLEPDYEDIKLN